MRLREGGVAIFVAEKRSHQKVRLGRRLDMPLDRKMLRVLVFEKLKLARTKRPEEVRPWAIIVARAPEMPVRDLDMVPEMRRPMWQTEE